MAPTCTASVLGMHLYMVEVWVSHAHVHECHGSLCRACQKQSLEWPLSGLNLPPEPAQEVIGGCTGDWTVTLL